MKFLLPLVFMFISFHLFAQCPATAYAELDANDINAGILNGGDLWSDVFDTGSYEYPAGSGIDAMFAGGIWLSGLSPQGDLKLAAITYRPNGFDFFPGPISSTTGIASTECSFYDQLWKVQSDDIQIHINTAAMGIPVTPILSIAEWPGKGSTYHASNGIIIEEDLAPFIDANNNNIYDPENGDYPDIKGTQAIFSVFNDLGVGVHGYTGGDPMGVEIQMLAYSYNDPLSILHTSTFYDYKIINKAGNALFDCKFSLFLQGSIGTSADDYTGCDTACNASYFYNANPTDLLYGTDPPVQIIKMVDATPQVDFSSFLYIHNGVDPQTDPYVEGDFRSYQNGTWMDGTPFTFGGDGYLDGGAVTNYIFPGNPALCSEPGEWSECNADNNVSGICDGLVPGDYRPIMNFSGFDILLYGSQEFTIAAITKPTTNYTGCVNSDSIVVVACTEVQTIYEDSLSQRNQYDFPNATRITAVDHSKVQVYPNPVKDIVFIDFAEDVAVQSISVYSPLGQEILFREEGFNHIDVGLIPSGSYLVKIETDKGIIVKKLSINR